MERPPPWSVSASDATAILKLLAALLAVGIAIARTIVAGLDLRRKWTERRLFEITGAIDDVGTFKIRIRNVSSIKLRLVDMGIVDFAGMSRAAHWILGIRRRIRAVDCVLFSALPARIRPQDSMELFGRVTIGDDSSLANARHLHARLDLGGRVSFHALERVPRPIITPGDSVLGITR